MTDNTISQLLAALRHSPGNSALRVVVIRMLLESGDTAAAAETAAPLEPNALGTPADRRTVADALRRSGKAAAALSFLESDEESQTLLAKARVLLALERVTEARSAYERAITANPALEDADLKRAVNTTIRVFGREGQPALKVIANDNTDDADVVRLLAPAADKITFKDVGGLSAVKKTIHRKIILPFQKPSLFERFKKRAGGGILFYGPPGCGLPLFTSEMKFESGTGWPSFFTSIPGVFETKKDFFLIYPRTEYHCIRCGGHHGHLFDDGPPPTQERWCNNGVALKFIPKDGKAA